MSRQYYPECKMKIFVLYKFTPAMFFLCFFLPLGCARQPIQNDAQTIRGLWAQEWVNSANVLVGRAYAHYSKEEAPNRRELFVALIQGIDVARTRTALYGPQVLDLLGFPDYWATGPDGRVILLYRFTVYRPPVEHGISRMSFDEFGRLDGIGWGPETIINSPKYHRFR
jgi:hypothetical protein